MDLTILAQLIVGGLLLGGVYALAAAGLNLIFGVMRVVNVAHGDLMIMGAYLTFFIHDQFELNPLLTLLVSAPVLFVVGGALQATLVRRVVGREPLMSLILMWGLSILLINLGLFFFTANYRSVPYFTGGIEIMGISISRSRGIAFIAALLLSLVVWLFLQRTRWGKAIRATAQSSEMARVCGINVARVRVLTFALAAAMAGAAGTLLVTFLPVTPGAGPSTLLRAFTIVVVGGLGSFLGAFIGALVIGVVEALSGFWLNTQVAEAVVYFTLIIFLLVRPGGLMRVVEE
jgi:branched-chain amino acid transport system permease protein